MIHFPLLGIITDLAKKSAVSGKIPGIDTCILADLFNNFRVQDFPGMIRHRDPDTGIVSKKFYDSHSGGHR